MGESGLNYSSEDEDFENEIHSNKQIELESDQDRKNEITQQKKKYFSVENKF